MTLGLYPSQLQIFQNYQKMTMLREFFGNNCNSRPANDFIKRYS